MTAPHLPRSEDGLFIKCHGFWWPSPETLLGRKAPAAGLAAGATARVIPRPFHGWKATVISPPAAAGGLYRVLLQSPHGSGGVEIELKPEEMEAT